MLFNNVFDGNMEFMFIYFLIILFRVIRLSLIEALSISSLPRHII